MTKHDRRIAYYGVLLQIGFQGATADVLMKHAIAQSGVKRRATGNGLEPRRSGQVHCCTV
jgi:hypothetical protein